MNKLCSDRAWDDYLYWQVQDKKTFKNIKTRYKANGSVERHSCFLLILKLFYVK